MACADLLHKISRDVHRLVDVTVKGDQRLSSSDLLVNGNTPNMRFAVEHVETGFVGRSMDHPNASIGIHRGCVPH